MSIGANVGKTSQNSQTSVDPQTQAWIKQIMSAAQGAGAAGPSPLVTGAANTFTGQQAAGATGTAALAGDPNAVATLTNPYTQQVIDAMNKQWQSTNAQDLTASDANATAAGAFGGSRAAIQNASVLAQNNLNQNTQNAGLLSQGYTNAINQAQVLAQMGANAASSNAGLGLNGVGSQQQWLLNMLKQGFSGLPYGTSSSGSSTNASGGFNLSIPFLGGTTGGTH